MGAAGDSLKRQRPPNWYQGHVPWAPRGNPQEKSYEDREPDSKGKRENHQPTTWRTERVIVRLTLQPILVNSQESAVWCNFALTKEIKTMAHEIAFINGRAQIAYLEEEGLPWHGLGTPMPANQPLKVWAEAAGLNWEAVRKPMFYCDEDGAMVQLNRNVLIHSETGNDLGIVTDSYKIVQPREILQAFKEIAADAGYQLKTAGNLRAGRRIWALADCGDEFALDKAGKDRVRRNILLSTSFDGSMATIVEPTTVRVVCQNTLSMAAGSNGENAKVRISHHSEFDPASLRADLLDSSGDIEASWEQFKERALRLASRRVSMHEAIAYFTTLFSPQVVEKETEEGTVLITDNLKRNLTQVMEIYTNGLGQETSTSRDTAWGLVNAVTRWADHERNSRTDAGRLNSAFFGDGADKKNAAMTAALALAA